MGSPWLSRLAVATAAAGALTLSVATAAWADTTTDVQLNQTKNGKTVTAGGFDKKDCTGPLKGLPEGVDGWHFVVPGTANFVSVDLTFKDATDAVREFTDLPATQTTKPDPIAPTANSINYFFTQTGSGTDKHLYVYTLAGWTLTGGTATITGSADFFNLSHTCPSGYKPPTTTPPTTTAPPSSSQPPSSGASSSAPGGGGSLPVTGVSTGGLLGGAAALLVGGVALMMVRRRRAVSELTES